MKDLTKIYIDLSKLSEEGQKDIISLLPPTKTNSLEIFEESVYLHYIEYWGKWVVDDILSIKGKTELTYPDFIKLFEGGEDYPGKQYQPLFDHLNSEHGIILLESEMDEIIRIVGSLNSNQNQNTMSKKKTRHSAKDGKFVSKEFAEANPDEVVEVTNHDHKEGWINVSKRLPELLETVWISNGKGWTSLGCRVETNEGWNWALSVGIIYEEKGKIIAECEDEDLDVVWWHSVPDAPTI